MAGEDDQKFFFMHLHKTGGTALWMALKREFAPAQVYPGPEEAGIPNVTMSVEDLVARWPARRREVSVVAGHFPLCIRDMLGNRFTTFTVLREPVARVVSSLRKQRQSVPDFAEMSLEEIYALPVRKAMLRNHMVKMLALTPDDAMPGMLRSMTFAPAHLERAKQQLETVEEIGFQEDLDALRERLTQRFGWQLGPNNKVNASDPVEVSASLRELIATENELDIELYEFARDRFADPSVASDPCA